MVRLGLTNTAMGRREDGRMPSQHDPEQSYILTADERIRQYTESHNAHTSNPRNPFYGAEENQSELCPSGSLHSNHMSEILPAPPGVLNVLNRNAQTSHLLSAEYSQRIVRTHDVPSRIPENQISDNLSSSSLDINYIRDVRFCPLCRSPIIQGRTHHCKIITEEADTSHTSLLNASQHHPLSKPSELQEPHTVPDNLRDLPESSEPYSIQSRLIPNLLPISQESPYSPEIHQYRKKTGNLETIICPTRSDKSNSVYDVHNRDDVVSPLGGEPSQGSLSVWPARSTFTRSDDWETPTSLISRLTAGLTGSSSQSQQQGDIASLHANCPSPSISEESDSLSFTCLEDSAQAEDPFYAAHQELMDEILKGDTNYHSSCSSGNSNNHQHNNVKIYSVKLGHTPEKSHKPAHSDNLSSNLMILGSGISRECDTGEQINKRGNTDVSSQLPDLDTILKSLKLPTIVPYVPDRSNIHNFLDPEEIGHINHLIKSLSDSVLTISLPDGLYNNKGFTPLDYMDIHLNAVIRQFFFVFKNEDFLNFSVSDQISLLNSCSLRAVVCSGLYLFSKDTSCWYIPGASNKLNHPVVHISDLLQVFPQHIVSKIYELHKAAASLDFDWSMGVITNCILMYTPLKMAIEEMERVDYLRNKYVHLLLKYISWKHGHHNAALVFPELLKILDALLLLVDELSVITLNMSEEEVMAVEKKLSTLTVMQMTPLKSHSSRFKEEVASWSSLKCVNLTEVNNRLCMALHLSLMESLYSNTAEYWTASSLFCTYNSNHDDNSLVTFKESAQILPASEKRQLKDKYASEFKNVNTVIPEKDLLLLRQFLEDATSRENASLIENLKLKMNTKQIQLVIKKLCL